MGEDNREHRGRAFSPHPLPRHRARSFPPPQLTAAALGSGSLLHLDGATRSPSWSAQSPDSKTVPVLRTLSQGLLHAWCRLLSCFLEPPEERPRGCLAGFHLLSLRQGARISNFTAGQQLPKVSPRLPAQSKRESSPPCRGLSAGPLPSALSQDTEALCVLGRDHVSPPEKRLRDFPQHPLAGLSSKP